MLKNLCTVELEFEYTNGFKDTVINSQVYKSDKDEYINNSVLAHYQLAKLNNTKLKSWKAGIDYER